MSAKDVFWLSILFWIMVWVIISTSPTHGQESSLPTNIPHYAGQDTTPIELDVVSEFHEPNEETSQGAKGYIIYTNRLAVKTDTTHELVQTPFGDFVFEIQSTTNHKCKPVRLCPDYIELVEQPDGYTVYPPFAEVAERDYLIIEIFPILGM